MAHIVLAGRFDDPNFARAELLADKLARALPEYHVRKLPVAPADWPEWLATKCREEKWTHAETTLVWREAGEENPAAMYIGDWDAFKGLSSIYYGVSLEEEEEQVADNTIANGRMGALVAPMPLPKAPLSVCITGAAGQTAYNLVYHIASGYVFGDDQPLQLRLLDLPPLKAKMDGLRMELEDCAFPLCPCPEVHTNPDEAFADVDIAVLLAAIPREAYSDPMLRCTNRRDVLRANTVIFKEHGLSLNRVGKSSTKVVVVANPSNTNALIVAAHASNLPRANFSCLSRLDQNRTAAQVAQKLNVAYHPEDHDLHINGRAIRNITVWGNHSDTQVPDVSHAFVINEGGIFGAGATAPVKALIQDKAFLTNDLMTLVRRRGKAIVRARRVTPAMSAARAIADHLRDLWFGSEPGEWSSMGVMSDGNPYGVQPGIFFSFPVRIKAGGQWSFVGGLDLDEELRDKLSTSAEELRVERDAALTLCGLPVPVATEPDQASQSGMDQAPDDVTAQA